ncbi:MAG: ATP synthase F1 subunit gamma [Candidatus Dadabacteria bacterium]|nr:ATP synthase F1 subunit gamma [Candidatus Dadabacteria bacterium]
MPSLKQINTKIASIKGTRRIMSAMKLIAAGKMQRTQAALKAHRVYVDAYTRVARGVLGSCGPDAHPLLSRPSGNGKTHLVFLTSDRGLCGNYNNVLIKGLDSFLADRGFGGDDVKLTFIGNKGKNFFGARGFELGSYYTGVSEKNCGEVADEISSLVSKEFAAGETGEAVLVHSAFISALSRETVFETLLPLEIEAGEEGGEPAPAVFEPSKRGILDGLIPEYLRMRVEKAILESLTSEHSARMTAMESATNNADELIRDLTLLFNKTRQAIITTELMDIVNGTEALREGGND